MSHAIKNNLDAIMFGLNVKYEHELFYIVPKDYIGLSPFEVSKYVGTRKKCEENLGDYPGCKIL